MVMVNDEGEQQEHPSKTWPDVMIDAAVARSVKREYVLLGTSTFQRKDRNRFLY